MVVDDDAGDDVEQRDVRFLAEREHERVGLELFELACRLREAGLVELHPLEHELATVRVLDGREPLHLDSLVLCLLHLEVVSRHPVPGATVDHDRFLRAETPRGAGSVHRGVAAAVHRDPATERGALLAFHAAQQGDGIDDVRCLAGRDVGALADLGADCDEDGIETVFAHRAEGVRHVGLELDLDAKRLDPGDLGVENLARQPVARDPESHHPAGSGAGVADGHLVAEACQVVGGREPTRAGADDQHALPARLLPRARPSSLARSRGRRGSARPR